VNFDYTRAPEAARALAGCTLIAAGALSLMGITSAEALYGDVFTVHANEISDLAARTEDGAVLQPSGAIFNFAMVVSGLLLFAASYGLERGLGVPRVTRAVGLLAIGTLGVGLFPAHHRQLHLLFAGTTFVAGGLAGVLAAQVTAPPFRYASATLGVIALVALDIVVFGKSTFIYQGFGAGGIERWVSYPIILWQVAFGAFLLGGRGIVAARHPRVSEPPAAP
jgi:hypothetical membrane protein